MSIATRLGDWSGRGHVGEQAEAGGACSSEHCSCWSHAELRHPSWEVSIPGDQLARPSVHPRWLRGTLLCALSGYAWLPKVGGRVDPIGRHRLGTGGALLPRRLAAPYH